MAFNSTSFLVFFLVVTLAYFLSANRYRVRLLLVASAFFYAFAIPKYLGILLAVVFVDYSAGLALETTKGRLRKGILALSLLSNLGLLFVFKYYNFANDQLGQLLRWWGGAWQGPVLSWALPIGLSFHTFQSLAYVIEVYRGRQKAEKRLDIYALYVLFYPQLVAGPIERPQNLIPQLHQPKNFDYSRVTDGLRLMMTGFLKKMAVADPLSVVVNQVYAQPRAYSGLSLLIATWLFAFQIYCDFSGYTDIARGAARVMGFELMSNFDHPHCARSIREFWRRWHISLSTWFRDYVYIPLGGNRGNRVFIYRNILIVFTLSGLWHGASWNFVIWGALHGLYWIAEDIAGRWKNRIALRGSSEFLVHGLQVFLTFQMVAAAWIFFRADTLSDSLYIVRSIAELFTGRGTVTSALPLPVGSLVLVAALESLQFFQRRVDLWTRIVEAPVWLRWPIYVGACLIALSAGLGDKATFIYFQF